jgi:hypothetical protein
LLVSWLVVVVSGQVRWMTLGWSPFPPARESADGAWAALSSADFAFLGPSDRVKRREDEWSILDEALNKCDYGHWLGKPLLWRKLEGS